MRFLNHCTQGVKARTTDTQREFFFQKPQTFWLGRQIVLKFIGAFGVFLVDLSAPILVMFSIIQPLFLQKKTKPLYPHPKYLFEIGI